MAVTYINFNPLTDERVWFVNIQAFNAFIASLNVNITSASLPPATLTDIGGVKQIAIGNFVAPTVTASYVTIASDEGAVDVPSKQAYDELKNQADYMAVYIALLRSQLLAKGYIGS